MERWKGRIVTVEPDSTLLVVGVNKPDLLVNTEKRERDQAITQAMELVKKEWPEIDGLFFGGNMDSEDFSSDLIKKILPTAKRLIELNVSSDELSRAMEASIDGGPNKMLPVDQKRGMAKTITSFIFKVAAEDQETPKTNRTGSLGLDR